MFSFSVSCYVSKYIESVSVLWSIFSWPFALHGKWENEVNECDIKCLLRLSKVIIDRERKLFHHIHSHKCNQQI